MSKRYIRLKEWGQRVDITREPTEKYLSRTDGSLLKEKFRIRTDDDGFMVSDRARSSSARRLVVLGGSFAENLFVHEDRRMCSFLEAGLSSRGQEVRVLNAGMSGATLLHLVNVFLNKVIPVKPAAVMLMSGVNDMEVAFLEKGFWSCDQYVAPIVRHGAVSDHSSGRLPEPDLTARLRMLNVLHAVAQFHGIPLWITTLPHRMDYDDPYVMKMYRRPEAFFRKVEHRRMINAQTREFCRSNGIGLIDLETLLQGVSDIFYDEFHLNERGSKVVADLIGNEFSFADIVSAA